MKVLLVHVCLSLFSGVAMGAWDGSRFAWYTSAASDFSSGAPIGNGRLGALVYGSVSERITLNENSMWSGPFQNRVNPNASATVVGEARSQLEAGNITSGDHYALVNMAGIPTSPRQYNPLVDILLDFGHASSNVSSYTRFLDTSEGTASVTYNYNGVNYTRQYLASYPAGVVAFRLNASVPGMINVNISLSRTENVTENYANTSSSITGKKSISLSGNSGQPVDAIAFTAEARVVNLGGSVETQGASVVVKGATTVDVFFDAETSYRYHATSDRQEKLKKTLDSAVGQGYVNIQKGAIADHSNFLNRVSLDLGSSGSAGQLPTDQRLAAYKSNPENDPELPTLMFNFGRHLLLSSSRPANSANGHLALPPNLQGL